ncbi:hypothetical protein ABPG72_006389 [Tetrahymena utriculariae]
MSFAKPKDKRSCSKEQIKSPQRVSSGKKLIQQNIHNRLILHPCNKQQQNLFAQFSKREHTPNQSPSLKAHHLHTISGDQMSSPRETKRFTHQASNIRLNTSMSHVDRIDKLEENLNRVCCNLDSILPLLNLLDSQLLKNGQTQEQILRNSSSSANLFQKNESFFTLCKKLNDHEHKIQQQEKVIQSLKEKMDKRDHSYSFFNQSSNRSFQIGGKENMQSELQNAIKQLKLEEKISQIEINFTRELEQQKQSKSNSQSQRELELQISQLQKQIDEIQAQQEKQCEIQVSQYSQLQSNIINISNKIPNLNQNIISLQRNSDSSSIVNHQINAINDQISEFKEFKQFCWKEMDSLWRNIGHLFCEVEMRNLNDLQQKIDSQLQEIPSTLSQHEKILKIQIIEYFNLLSSIEKFNHLNQQRLMSQLKEYNQQIDKLYKQLQSNYNNFTFKEMDMYQQEIETLEDRFINIKFQIEGTKQKMIFELKKLEEKQQSLESSKLSMLGMDYFNKELVKQDLLIIDHLKQKIQQLMDDVGKNIKQISDESDTIMYRLTNQIKNGAISLDRAKRNSSSFQKSFRGSEQDSFVGSKNFRKYTFGQSDEIIYQPYTQNQFFIQLQAIQTDQGDEIKEY